MSSSGSSTSSFPSSSSAAADLAFVGIWAAGAPSISATGTAQDLDLSDNAPFMSALTPSTATGNPPAIDAYVSAPRSSQPWSTAK